MSTFLTGVGIGGTMAQEVAMRELGVMATGVASLGGTAEANTLTASDLPKTAMAVWQFQCASDSTTDRRVSQQADYWRGANGTNTQVVSTLGGLPTTTDSVRDNPVQQVKLSKLNAPAESYRTLHC